MDKTMTTTEIAKDLGVSIGAVSRFVKTNGLKPIKTGKNNSKLYSSSDYQIIKTHFSKGEDKTEKRENDDSINQLLLDRIREQSKMLDMLNEQLKIKDQQLAAKDKQIETASRLADQAQQLDLSTHNNQLKLAENGSESLSEGQSSGGFWSRLFK